MNGDLAVEDLLTQVAAFDPRTVGETYTLWVAETLTFRGKPIAHDIAMALVLDNLLAKGLFPAGFDVEHGGRRYKYRFEGQASPGAVV